MIIIIHLTVLLVLGKTFYFNNSLAIVVVVQSYNQTCIYMFQTTIFNANIQHPLYSKPNFPIPHSFINKYSTLRLILEQL